jgi:sterol desaturase/sphingolipid hydroxylase (fatty acid hydroxylase superfamily)
MTNFLLQQVYSVGAVYCLCAYSNEIYQWLFPDTNRFTLYFALYLMAINCSIVVLAGIFFSQVSQKYKIQPQGNQDLTPAFDRLIEGRRNVTLIISVICFVLSDKIQEIGVTRYHHFNGWDIFINLAMVIFYADLALFIFHKVSHLPRFYKYHQKHHQHKESTYLTGSWMSEVESAIIAVIVLIIPFFTFGLNIYEILCWMLIASCHNIVEHCGYDLPINPFNLIPLSTDTRHHDLHHSEVRCNYATYFSFFDIIFNTIR